MTEKEKKDEERPVKPERMDHIEKGAKIGKTRKVEKTKDNTKKSKK